MGCVQMKPEKWSEGITLWHEIYLFIQLHFLLCISVLFSGTKEFGVNVFIMFLDINKEMKYHNFWAPNKEPDQLKQN